MCGIAGFFYSKDTIQNRQAALAQVQEMTDAIAHRGPDGEGHFIGSHVSFGHRRLAIIDLHSGQQPLFNEDREVCVVFNGEIYNFQELVEQLTGLGHEFRTKSDTEVIVHAWEQWGVECLSRFQGMFAFALWDNRQKTLFCARDRLGVKPFFYGITSNNEFFFGSELKALRASKAFEQDLNHESVEDYVAFGYVPETKSIYRQYSKLPPATYLLWKTGHSQPVIQKYWAIANWNQGPANEKTVSSELRSILSDAVKFRMISDVPLGAFLSGGVDSSIVVALMAGLTQSPIKTCSIGFSAQGFDETAYASALASRYKTDHVTKIVTSDDYSLSETLAIAFDEPFADSSAIPTFRVSEQTRQRVTVALSGDGADEMFGGYRRYWMHFGENRIRSLFPGMLGSRALSSLAAIYPKGDWAPRVFRAKSSLQAAAMNPLKAYELAVSTVRPSIRMQLYSGDFVDSLKGYTAYEVIDNAMKGAPQDPLARLQHLDYQTYLPSGINTKVDRMSMANSLEVRAPFLDYRLVEWAARLPTEMKIKSGSGKKILKETFLPDIGGDIMHRPKQGFSVPIAAWFRGALKSPMEAVCENGQVVTQGILSQKALKSIFAQHVSGQLDHSSALWTVWMLEQFFKKSDS
jgi:asparagine synthase (glutamine-hydrolysing)